MVDSVLDLKTNLLICNMMMIILMLEWCLRFSLSLSLFWESSKDFIIRTNKREKHNRIHKLIFSDNFRFQRLSVIRSVAYLDKTPSKKLQAVFQKMTQS